MMPPLSVLLSNWEPHVQCPPCYPWPGSGTLRGLVIVRGLFCPRLLQGTRLQPVPHPSSHLPMSTSKPPPAPNTQIMEKEHPGLVSAASMPILCMLSAPSPQMDSPVSQNSLPHLQNTQGPEGAQGSLLDKGTHRGECLSPPTSPLQA